MLKVALIVWPLYTRSCMFSQIAVETMQFPTQRVNNLKYNLTVSNYSSIGCPAAFLCTPFDVIKTRLQVSNVMIDYGVVMVTYKNKHIVILGCAIIGMQDVFCCFYFCSINFVFVLKYHKRLKMVSYFFAYFVKHSRK